NAPVRRICDSTRVSTLNHARLFERAQSGLLVRPARTVRRVSRNFLPRVLGRVDSDSGVRGDAALAPAFWVWWHQVPHSSRLRALLALHRIPGACDGVGHARPPRPRLRADWWSK